MRTTLWYTNIKMHICHDLDETHTKFKFLIELHDVQCSV
jgi:hypothetical protein